MVDDLSPVTILVVDDEPTIRHLLKRWIARSTSAGVIEANNGLQGLEKLSSGKVDLVILDINMPVLNGIEMLSLVRADPSNSNLEIMVVSTVGSETQVREVISLGVSDYLLKPLQQERVLMRIGAAISRILDRRQQTSVQGDTSRTRILVADTDSNFCEVAVAALSTQFSPQAVKTTGEVLVKLLRFKPDVILLSPAIAGSRMAFLLDKIASLSKKRKVSVYALVDSPTEMVTEEGMAGCVKRSFVPETFASQVVALLGGGPAPEHGILSWITSLEPEINTALRQALGMMTGAESSETTAPPEAPACDLFGQIRLESANKDFELRVEIRSEKAFARGLVKMMLGIPDEEIDEPTQASGLQEILNVVAGRIKNSCQERGVDVMLGLPDISTAAPAPPRDVLHEKQMYFRWDEKHLFQLTFYGCTLRQPLDATPAPAQVMTADPTEQTPSSAGEAASSPGPEAVDTPSEPSEPKPPAEAAPDTPIGSDIPDAPSASSEPGSEDLEPDPISSTKN